MSAGAGQRRIRMAAHAKVNLHLAVGRRREDGYHELDTVFAAVGLSDDVTVGVGGGRDSLACDTDLGVPERDNLAWRAVEAYRSRYRHTGGVTIDLHKRIPAGAGLGGGSADAAAVLVALHSMLGGPVDGGLSEVALSLGADVPFFLGPGVARMSGIGADREESVRLDDPLHIVIVKPDAGVSTSEAYEAFDRGERSPAPTADAMLAALRAGDAAAVAAALYNNMAPGAIGLVPACGDALRFLEARPGVLAATVCGSGSAVFGVCASQDVAVRAAGEAAAAGWWSTATTTVDRGVEELAREPQAHDGRPT